MLEPLLPSMINVQSAFKAKKSHELRQIANQTIKRAALSNNPIEAKIAVIAYALHKLLSKQHVRTHKKWNTIQKIIQQKLADSIQSLKQKKAKKFEKNLEQITQKIRQTDSDLGNFVQNLMEKSRVKQASSLYAFGLSLGQATSLTNADKKNLFQYIGYTKLHDEQPSRKTMSERVAQLEGILE
ncbi:hypothetical protein KKE06_04170 [Candidatus Micrarchaeota archaeon]|nr:hypothetical protein [Candidatus Micrarchaeota archaeon]MBU1930283.1 hypothetical protein [Candidatus Micrarchaeota archaeon]